MTGNTEAFDFIIVGGGSAGCVLADRLSADGRSSVLLLEAGGSGRDPTYDLPMLAAHLFSLRRNNWSYRSEPQEHLGGRVMDFPRGRMLGGSFIFNGAQYIRGHRSDFDHWRQLGNVGWSYEDVLPYFRRSEDYRGAASPLHGKEGPLVVAKPPVVSPLSHAFVEACREAGYRLNDDFNGAEQDGFGIYDFNIGDGRRMTTARAFLRPAMGRPNLAVRTHRLVTRLAIRDGRAAGVVVRAADGEREIGARREVILAAGSFNSPKILILSGIGDAADLVALGIPVTRDLPGVGRNLQDHLNVSVAHAAKEPVSLAGMLRVHRMSAALLQAIFLRSGPVSRSPLEAGGFFRTRDGLAAPDVQAVFIPYYPGNGLKLRAPWAPRMEGHSFVVHVWPNRPESRGRMTLRSSDPAAPPIIDPRFLSAEGDIRIMRDAIRAMRGVMGQPALDRYRGGELAPGADIRSDAELDRFIREASNIGHHSCGTAKMGHDRMAVVDDRLAVHGVAGLRVADASIMPTMVSGNTNAATIMIAEKAADMALGRA